MLPRTHFVADSSPSATRKSARWSDNRCKTFRHGPSEYRWTFNRHQLEATLWKPKGDGFPGLGTSLDTSKAPMHRCRCALAIDASGLRASDTFRILGRVRVRFQLDCPAAPAIYTFTSLPTLRVDMIDTQWITARFPKGIHRSFCQPDAHSLQLSCAS
jgi:hypothetical protein